MKLKNYFDKEFWIYFIIGFVLLLIPIIILSPKYGGIENLLLLILLPSIFAVLIPFIISYIILSLAIQYSKFLAFFVVFLPVILASILSYIVVIIADLFLNVGEAGGFFFLFCLVYGSATSLYLFIIYIIKIIKKD